MNLAIMSAHDELVSCYHEGTRGVAIPIRAAQVLGQGGIFESGLFFLLVFILRSILFLSLFVGFG